MELSRITELAKEDPELKFFSIAHFLTPDALYEAFRSLRKDASAGVDRVTYEDYEKQALWKVRELHGRLKSKTYRALPLRRIYIPKEDGKRSLKRVADWCRVHRHDPVKQQQAVLNAKLRGHYQYYGRPSNYRSLRQFYRGVRHSWKKWLGRRTRGRPLTWEKYAQLLQRHPLLPPRIVRPWASAVSPT
jgi:hypothetical protein